MHPDHNQIEITVFGPGYGEAIAIHIGSGKWILIDSCLNDDKKPASLEYLKKLGVDVQNDVVAVAASHWHDDHIKGLSSVLEACKSAKFCLSSAFKNNEFVGFLQAFEDQPVQKLDRGGTELLRCMRLVSQDKRSAQPLHVDTIVYDCDHGTLAHGNRVELRALSPSSAQFVEFLRRVNSYVASSEGQPKKRLVDPGRNDLSIVMLLTVGERSMLLGADLEESMDLEQGWKAIVDLRRGRTPRPRTFKIPHHGSENAHSDDVWDDILHVETFSVVTPWRKGGRALPTENDQARIKSRSKAAYITSSQPRSLKNIYGRDVSKLLRQLEVDLISVTLKSGAISFRWKPEEQEPEISLYNGALQL